MKKLNLIHIVLLLLFFSTTALGQNPNVEICNSFDSNITRIEIDSSSIWKIGSPNKTILNGSFNSLNSIVTNVDSLYPPNDTSVFTATFEAPNYLGLFLPISIEFTHRFMTDTIFDFGEVEISFDNGDHWINLLSDTLNHEFDTPPGKGNFHIYENTNDTVYDNLIISGSSNGWIHSKFYKDVLGQPDSIIMVKFTFNSDSIGGNEGWQIDDLCISEDYLTSVSELENPKHLKVFPNPSNGNFIVEITPESNQQEFIFELYDILGKRVFVKTLYPQQNTINVSHLASGVYTYKIGATWGQLIVKKF